MMILGAAALLAGCSGAAMTAASVANRATLGMSVEEFRRMARPLNGTVELDAMSAEGTVYRIDEWAGEGKERRVVRTRLYFFDKQERLAEIATRDLRHPFSHMR